MVVNKELDVKIRVILLFEYCKRSYGKSENPEMHFYKIPELCNINNKIIESNAIYLIDENLVRGGIDVNGSYSFPGITRINSSGIKLVERIIDESELKIPELQDELKDKTNTQEKILCFIAFCFKKDDFPIEIMNVTQDIIF